MLVKSVVCKLTGLPRICIGSFPPTNNRSLNLLNQIWNIFRQRAPDISSCNPPAARTEKQPLLRAAPPVKPMAWHLAGVQAWQGILGYIRKTKPIGSLIHVAVHKSFIGNKDANSPKQPSTRHFTNVTLEVPKQPATVSSRTLSNSTSTSINDKRECMPWQ